MVLNCQASECAGNAKVMFFQRANMQSIMQWFPGFGRLVTVCILAAAVTACQSEQDDIEQLLSPLPSLAPSPSTAPTATPSPSQAPTATPAPRPTATPSPVALLRSLEFTVNGQNTLVTVDGDAQELTVEYGSNQFGPAELSAFQGAPGAGIAPAVGSQFDLDQSQALVVRSADNSEQRSVHIRFVQDQDFAQLQSSAVEQSCTDFALFDDGSKWLENNTWNVESFTQDQYSQCIFRGPAPAAKMGWSWSFPLAQASEVYSYPEIIFGWKPWFQQSTTVVLPKRLDSIRRLDADFAVETYSIGSGLNLAFDMWITQGAVASLPAIRYELMVWEYEPGGVVPFGDLRATLRTSEGRYLLYQGEPDWEPEGANWTYLAFVREQPRLQGVVPIGEMIEALIQAEIVDPDLYLASIGFGNEIGASSGYTVVHRYDLSIESNSAP